MNTELKPGMTLKDAMPPEFGQGGEYYDVKAQKMAGVLVTEICDGTEIAWPGPQRNVFKWVKLANGYAVGWNENPQRGWFFPVIRLKQ